MSAYYTHIKQVSLHDYLLASAAALLCSQSKARVRLTLFESFRRICHLVARRLVSYICFDFNYLNVRMTLQLVAQWKNMAKPCQVRALASLLRQRATGI